MPDVIGLLEKAELAIASATRLADESKVAPLASATALLRRRLDYPDDILLVALAGGTGSGKSSLLNSLVGEEVAAPGGVRPTTNRPLAVAAPTSLARMNGYLSALGVTDTASVGAPSWLCLVDLPDTDSVELDHRLQVDSLVARVDVVIWVVDPQKYRDASLHHGYLQQLSAHSNRFLFALNQIDRVDPGMRDALSDDFVQALDEDRIEDPQVIATAAAPRAGPPIGIDRLMDALDERRGSAVYAKVLSDLDDAVAVLVSSTGRSGLGFEERASEAADKAALLIATGRGHEATDVLIDLLEELRKELTHVAAQRIGSLVARVPRQVQQIADSSNEVTPEAAIDNEILAPVRDVLRERASSLALITDLSLSVASTRSRLGV
jgi:Fe2+ transport system protein B